MAYAGTIRRASGYARSQFVFSTPKADRCNRAHPGGLAEGVAHGGQRVRKLGSWYPCFGEIVSVIDKRKVILRIRPVRLVNTRTLIESGLICI